MSRRTTGRAVVLGVGATALALVAGCSSVTDAEPAATAPVRSEPVAFVAPAAAANLPAYTSSSRKAKKSDVKSSWHKGCPVGPSSLRVVKVRYLGFDKKAHMGTLVVHKSTASDVRKVFGKLYKVRFAIKKMVPVDVYKGSDRKSMVADNTSAFNCRNVAGTSRWSNHAYGRAIDINPVENPYVNGSTVSPKAGKKYLNRKLKVKGLIHRNGKVVKAFRAEGFTWGGAWSDPDYQHFDLRR